MVEESQTQTRSMLTNRQKVVVLTKIILGAHNTMGEPAPVGNHSMPTYCFYNVHDIINGISKLDRVESSLN
jgi:hypothetical protein